MLIKKGFAVALIFSAVLLLMPGCSSDEENPITPTPPPEPPEFSMKQIVFPQQMLNSTHAMAQQAIALVEEVLAFESHGCQFAPPSDAQALKETADEWEYKWNTGDLAKTLQITSVSGRDTWKIFYDGAQGGKNYNNWRFMDAVQSSSMTSGHITLFKAGALEAELEWVWYTLESNDYKLIKQFYGDPPYKIEITVKQDNSGKIDKYTRNSTGNMVYDLKFSWNANGAGSYWTFEDGVQTSSGTW